MKQEDKHIAKPETITRAGAVGVPASTLPRTLERVSDVFLPALLNLSGKLREEGIDHQNYLLLRHLGGRSLLMREIAEILNITGAAATGVVRKLENLDLVERITPKDDRRKIFVNLSEKGADLVDDLHEATRELIAGALDADANGKTEQFDEICGQLSDLVELEAQPAS